MSRFFSHVIDLSADPPLSSWNRSKSREFCSCRANPTNRTCSELQTRFYCSRKSCIFFCTDYYDISIIGIYRYLYDISFKRVRFLPATVARHIRGQTLSIPRHAPRVAAVALLAVMASFIQCVKAQKCAPSQPHTRIDKKRSCALLVGRFENNERFLS